jgi:outer membrane receptor protein involved in Fe transport
MSSILHKRALLPLALGFAITQIAFAQTVEDTEEKTTEATEEQELETITVTGSRIKRAGLDTLEPATSIGREDISRRGNTNVADSLNELPGFGAGITPEGGQAGFGAAVNFVNRFGLGSARTLTTVNGRRFVSSNPVTIFGSGPPGLQVDLNAIPTQLIERVDNLTVGGAPVYGSDAIAGVVNVILRQDYEGTEVGMTYGLTSRGDNERVNVRALTGFNFADGRGNVTLSASVDTSDGVNQIERELFRRAPLFGVNPLATALGLQPGRTPQNDGRVNTSIPFNTGPADGIPNAVLIYNRRLSQLTPGGLLFPATGGTLLDPNATTNGGILRGFGPDSRTLLQFDRNGNAVTYNQGTPFGNTDASGGDGWYLVENGQIISDLNRASIFSNGGFDFTDSTRGYYEALFFRSEGVEINDQPIFNATQFGGLSAPLTSHA